MTTAVLTRYGFLSLDPDLNPDHARLITKARGYASSVIDQLAEFRRDVGGSSDFTREGKQARILAAMDKATAELRGTFKSARVGPDEEADGHNGRFQQNLWGSVPEAGLEKEQRTLLHLLSRESATAPTTLPTTTDGDALLGNGGPTHRLLLKIVSEGSEEEAKAVTLAVLRGGVVLRSMLGGEPVARALVKAVEGRVIENDATAAAILAARDAARGVSDTLTNDEQAALRAAESALGLPAGIAAGRERALAAKQKK